MSNTLKKPVGRPKHVADYAQGAEARNNFLRGIQSILKNQKRRKKAK